jgi:hypothetical protein
VLAALPPSVVPIPIGVGARYQPAPAAHARPGLRCTSGGARYGVHLELFAHRRVVVVPAGIGVPRFRRAGADVEPRGCSLPVRTRTPTGVLEVRRGLRLTLGQLFDVWGKPLSRFRLADFRSTRPVLAFLDGKRWRGDPRTIPLRRHAQIVLELGGYIPPHPSYLFPAGL